MAALRRRNLQGPVVALALAVALVPLGCGGGAKPVSDREARRVASAFADALVEQRDKTAALVLAEPDLELLVEVSIPEYRKAKMHVRSRPMAGCTPQQTAPFTLPNSGRCYRFRLRGDPVCDRQGVLGVAFGTLYVSVSKDGGKTKVNGFAETGGGGGVGTCERNRS